MKILTRTVDIAMSVLAVLTIALLVVAWPARLGGSATLVFISGPSMEPTLQSEDLVIAKKRSEVHVGDVIVYRVSEGPAAGQLIVHRVIGGNVTTGLTTKGDNNPTADPYRPTGKDVVGKVWIQSGQGGLLRGGLRLLVTPWIWAVFGALVAFVVSWRVVVARDRSEHRPTA
jgi:signal peptidase I